MIRVVAIKELRDTVWIAVLALGIGVLLSSLQGRPHEPIPFLGDGFSIGWSLICWLLTIAIALRQSLWERPSGTYLFLLQRPAQRSAIFGVKIAVGLLVLQVASALPVLAHIAWARSPHAYSSPFALWMTRPAWFFWLSLPVVYLAAFLSGMLPARWFGTRSLPVLAASALMLAMRPSDGPQWFGHGMLGLFNADVNLLWMFATSATCSAALVYLVFYVCATRDFG